MLATRLASIWLALGLLACTDALNETTEPPNIILLIADDQGYRDFGFMGSPHVHTPNLDRLAEGGTVFTLAHNTSSECKRSLNTLLTGLYPYQWELMLGLAARAPRPQQPIQVLRAYDTLPRQLARAGYVSFEGGKYWLGTLRTGGFSEGMVTRRSNPLAPGDEGSRLGRETLEPVLSFIDRHEQQRFFMWIAPKLPHLPHDAPARYFEPYSEAELTMPAERYFAACTWLDAVVGELLAHLEKRGLRERTLVVFLSDNGWDQPHDREIGNRSGFLLGGPRGKFSMHDAGFRTPIVFNWPARVPAGKRIDELVSTVDLFPTLIELAGLPERPELPGRSLLPLMEGSSEPLREFLVGDMVSLRDDETGPSSRRAVVPASASYLRNRGWHFIRYETWDRVSLYDMRSDPEEQHDVSAEHPELVRRFAAEIEGWRGAMRVTARNLVPPRGRKRP